MEKNNVIAKEVILSLFANSIIDGFAGVYEKMLRQEIEKALQNALSLIPLENEFWKNDVENQKDMIIALLFQIMNDTKCVNKKELPIYLDEETIAGFRDCLKENTKAWDYLKIQLQENILCETRTVSRLDEKQNHSTAATDDHFLTSPSMFVNATNVIGREEDLQKLWKALKEKKHVMLTGSVGSGKTTLAQLLFHKYKSEFEEVAWVVYQGDLKKSFMACINIPLFHESKYQNENERWFAIKNILANDGKTKLIVIDNVDTIEGKRPDQDKELLDLANWKDASILLISKMHQLNGFEIVSLDSLNHKNSLKIFDLYYRGKDSNQKLVSKIVDLANGQPMSIELLAKGASRENLDDYYNKLIIGGFESVDKEMTTINCEGDFDVEGPLRMLYKMQGLPELDKQILNSFAILPANCKCTIKEIEQWFGFKNVELDGLIHDGWLSYDTNEKTYSLHQLIRTIVRFDFTKDENGKCAIAPQGTADKILDYFEEHNELFDINNGFVSLQRLIGVVESVMAAVDQEESDRFSRLYKNIAYSYDSMGDYNNALEYYEKALKVLISIYGKEDPSVAMTYSIIAGVYHTMGNYTSALEYYEKAMKIMVPVLGEDHPETTTIYNSLAMVYHDMGDYNMSLRYYWKALEIIESKMGNDLSYIASTYDNMAGVFSANGDYDKALECYGKAMAIRESKLGKDHPSMATTYNNMAVVFRVKGDYDKALDYYGKALAISESKLGKDHPDTATTYNNMASVYEDMGDYDKALEYYGKALMIVESKLGKDHPSAATTYDNTAGVFSAKGDYDKALEYYRKAMEIRESKLGKDHFDTASTYNNIALAYKAKGDYDEALEYYEKALEISESKLGKNHPDTATTYNNIAGVYYAKGDYAKALEYYEKAMLIYESKLGKRHSSTATTYNNMAGVFSAKGDYVKALEYYLLALKIWLNKDARHPNAKVIIENLYVCYEASKKEMPFEEWLIKRLNEKE